MTYILKCMDTFQFVTFRLIQPKFIWFEIYDILTWYGIY